MTRRVKVKIIVILAVALLGALALLVSSYIYVKYFWEFNLPSSHPIRAVNAEGWPKLHSGMTKEEVAALLGESEEKGTISVLHDGKDLKTGDWWAYNWSSAWGHSPKAYIVNFDSEGKTSSFTGPAPETPAKEPTTTPGPIHNHGVP